MLQVDDLKVHFPIHKGLFKRVAGHVRAVDGVSLSIHSGRTLALVGESGCGKTTVGKGILQLIRPTAGSVRFGGDELTQLKGAELRARRADFQIVFQDPYSSLDPRMRVADIIEEGMVALGAATSPLDRQNSMIACCSRSDSHPTASTAIPTNSPEASASVLRLLVPWR
jgi:peptide/nickel transport system ATP-binding protein